MCESQNTSNQTQIINDCKRGFKSSEEIFAMADKKLYYGKEHGRGRLVVDDLDLIKE